MTMTQTMKTPKYILNDHYIQEKEELIEEDAKIASGLDWKRRHFFINCFYVTMFLMFKLEFSYTDIFGKNILYFQIAFQILDIFIEQGK